MKRINLFLLMMVCVISSTFAGNKDTYNTAASEWSMGINATALDFYTPKLNTFSSFKQRMAIGPDINFTRNFFKTGLGVSANLLAPAGLAPKTNASLPDINKYLLMVGPGLVYNFQNAYLIKPHSPVAPYVFANALGSWARVPEGGNNDKLGFGIPLGLGLNFKIADGVALNTKAGYMVGVTEFFDNNLFWSAGLNFGLGKNNKPAPAPVVVAPVVVDTDGDGIADENDDCPEVFGLASLNGCPDTDGDGITDLKDECPEVAGLAQFNGCPDRDGDGIADHKDECTDVAGLAKFNGCPEPDTDGDGLVDSKDRCPNASGPVALGGCPDRDGDGVADIDDKCPDKVGPASNKGCPEVRAETKKRLEYAASAVKFQSGKAVLTKESFKVLDEVAAIMKEYDDYAVSVEGHTDASGSKELNNKLSVERAKVCADYLISKGIEASRVSSAGFGPDRPIADNATPEGRAKNRRTEFVLGLK